MPPSADAGAAHLWKVVQANPTTAALVPKLWEEMQPDAMCVQELLRPHAAVRGFQKSMNAISAHCLANASVATPAGGLSAGVALCSTWAAGLADFEVPLVKAPTPERFKAALWDAVVQGGVLIGSVYLVDGIGLADLNINLLQEIAGYVKAIGLPYILSGDWNVTPAVLESSGWPSAMLGTVVAPESHTYSAGGVSDVKDFF